MADRTDESQLGAVNAGLLLLRVTIGVGLFLVFGLLKIKDASAYLHTGKWGFIDFNRQVGLPLPTLIAWVQTINEVLGSLFVAVGLLGRYAATLLTIGFIAATACSLKMNEPSWMTAAFFAAVFAALALTGPGKFSVDYVVAKMRRSKV